MHINEYIDLKLDSDVAWSVCHCTASMKLMYVVYMILNTCGSSLMRQEGASEVHSVKPVRGFEMAAIFLSPVWLNFEDLDCLGMTGTKADGTFTSIFLSERARQDTLQPILTQ